MTLTVKPLVRLAFASALALAAGCQSWHDFWHRSTVEQDAQRMEDPFFPDERRTGITGLQRKDELYDDAYRTRLRTLAAKDEAPEVRAQALRALNQSRDTASTNLFVASLADAAPQVRLEAAKALRHFPADSAVPPLTKLATSQEETHDVRIWSATALGQYPRFEVSRTLIDLLADKDFGVAYAARESLQTMTGKDYHYESATWLTYLTTTGPKAFRTLPKPAAQ